MDNELAMIFNLIDKDKKGFITEADLRNSSTEALGEEIIRLMHFRGGGGEEECIYFDQFCSKIREIRGGATDAAKETCFEGQGESQLTFLKAGSNPFYLRKKKAAAFPTRYDDEATKELLKLILSRLNDIEDLRKSDLETSEASRRIKHLDYQNEMSSKCDKRQLEAVEWEKSSLLQKLEVANDRVYDLEKQLIDKENLVQRKRHDMTSLQRHFDVLAKLVEDTVAEKNSLVQEMTSLKEKEYANHASLNNQRELLHKDRVAFTLERIAFDNLRAGRKVELEEKVSVGHTRIKWIG